MWEDEMQEEVVYVGVAVVESDPYSKTLKQNVGRVRVGTYTVNIYFLKYGGQICRLHPIQIKRICEQTIEFAPDRIRKAMLAYDILPNGRERLGASIKIYFSE